MRFGITDAEPQQPPSTQALTEPLPFDIDASGVQWDWSAGSSLQWQGDRDDLRPTIEMELRMHLPGPITDEVTFALTALRLMPAFGESPREAMEAGEWSFTFVPAAVAGDTPT